MTPFFIMQQVVGLFTKKKHARFKYSKNLPGKNAYIIYDF